MEEDYTKNKKIEISFEKIYNFKPEPLLKWKNIL
jgi:hypothetical protein